MYVNDLSSILNLWKKPKLFVSLSFLIRNKTGIRRQIKVA